jgi:hypothetical protein
MVCSKCKLEGIIGSGALQEYTKLDEWFIYIGILVC